MRVNRATDLHATLPIAARHFDLTVYQKIREKHVATGRYK